MIARELTIITTTISNNSRIERSFDRCHRILKLVFQISNVLVALLGQNSARVTVSYSHCPIQRLRKLFLRLCMGQRKVLHTFSVLSCHVH